MITITGTPKHGKYHVEVKRPDKPTPETLILDSEAGFIRFEQKAKREYIVEKLKEFLTRCMFTPNLSQRSNSSKVAAELLVALKFYKMASLRELARYVAEHDEAIESLEQSPNCTGGLHLNYVNTIIPILVFCRIHKGSGVKDVT